MKPFVHTFMIGFAVAGLTTSAPAAAPDASDAPRIEVAFVLDTTGSMGGLIEGAKQKIWSIANEITRSSERQPAASVKIGLIGYRDRGDVYVTKVFDLTDDIDAIYGHLMAFEANGGGDLPESVNQALHEAVHKLTWSTDPDVFKVIFLVGDAPPHMDYEQDVQYPETCENAVKKDLVINTIQCGQNDETTRVWQDIASRSEGKFVQIGQSGDMVVRTTPFDGEVSKLNMELAATAVPYGEASQQREAMSKLSISSTAPAAAAADRMLYMNQREGGRVMSGRGDLLTDVAEGVVTLDSLKSEEWPADLRDATPTERAAYLRERTAKRTELQKRINELLRQRQTHLDQQKQKQIESGQQDSFDEQVSRIITEQREARQKR